MSSTYAVGDDAVLEGQGPVEIVGTTEHAGTEMFEVESKHDRYQSYYVPVDRADEALRNAVSEDRARELLDEKIRGAHPDDRGRRDRAKDGTYALEDGGLEDQLAVLGSMYATGIEGFGERKLAGELEQRALQEVADVLGRERDALADELKEGLADVDREPRSPELTPRPEVDVESVPDDGPEVAGYTYLGTFGCRGELVVGDPTYVTDEELDPELQALLDVRTGLWDAYLRVEDDHLSDLVVVHRSMTERMRGLERTPRRELRVDTGRLATVDAALRTREGVAFELRQYLRQPEVRDWGAGSPTDFGDGYYEFATHEHGGEVVLVDIDLW